MQIFFRIVAINIGAAVIGSCSVERLPSTQSTTLKQEFIAKGQAGVKDMKLPTGNLR